MAPAPGLLSMMTGWPRSSDNFCPTIRAIRSLPPPGVKPTTMWIGRLGYFAGSSCADADGPSANSPRQAPRIKCRANAFIDGSLRLPRGVLKSRHMNMQHGGLAVMERGKAAVDRGGK